jgi:flagellar basal-body rod protein FlgF
MINGLYFSAAGVRANSHRLDVLTNNLANTETSGFKRDLAVFQQRLTEAQASGPASLRLSNRDLEALGGGVALQRDFIDMSEGELEETGNQLDFALRGPGFFAVRQGEQTYLTRDGRFTLNHDGVLVSATGGQWVLDQTGNPIKVKREVPLVVSGDGVLSQSGEVMGRVGVFNVPRPGVLVKVGGGRFTTEDLRREMFPAHDKATVVNGVVERSNADPVTELARVIDAQRALEANANLIRYQDQTLGRLVNDVARIS